MKHLIRDPEMAERIRSTSFGRLSRESNPGRLRGRRGFTPPETRSIRKTGETIAEYVDIIAKCNDMFSAEFFNSDHEKIMSYDGYVPKWFGGKRFGLEDHYGDYVSIRVNLRTGKIIGFQPMTERDIEIMATEGELKDEEGTIITNED